MGWMWSGLGWVLLAAGLGVVVWGLFWDRAGWRGRAALRCRKCWYDLTGVGAGAVERATAGDPVVCPECGRGHRSARAMRRTRRRWGWVVVGGVVLVLSFVVRSGGEIRKRGWIAAIPDTVLVMAIPLTSDAPGSSFGWTIWGNGQGTGWLSRIEDEIRTKMWSQRLGWLSNRVLFVIARSESDEVLTDSTTTRGSLYMHRIRQILDQDGAYGFEVDWARSVVHAEFRTRERWAPGATVYGELKIRRLLQDEYRVELSGNSAWFEARPLSDVLSVGGAPPWTGPGIRNVQEYIERDQWDVLERIARIRVGESPGDLMVQRGGIPLAVPAGPVTRTEWVDIYDASGNPRLGVHWTHSGRMTMDYGFVVDPAAGPEVIADQAMADAIASGIHAELSVGFDADAGRWALEGVLWLSSVRWPHPITFGGRVSVVARLPDGSPDRFRPLLRGPSLWWRWIPVDEVTLDGGFLVSADLSGAGIPFEDGGNPLRRSDPSARLYLLISGGTVGADGIVFADPQAERVLVGDLVIPIKHWTVGELNQYRVSGVVPDHAMR